MATYSVTDKKKGTQEYSNDIISMNNKMKAKIVKTV